MEQIVVTRKDGSTTYVLNGHGTMVTSAKQVRSLLEDDYVDVELVSVDVPDVRLGDHIDVYGRRYTVNQLPVVEKRGSRNHTVKVRFEGVQYTMARVSYMLSVDTTSLSLQDVRGNSLIGDIGVFLTVMAANLNRVFPGEWSVGEYPQDTDADTLITFDDNDNCLSVLQTLCDVFDSEFDITTSNGVNHINVRERNMVFPHPFKYGKMSGLYELSRSNSDSDNIVNKMYVYGGTRNLTQNYLCDRLVLRNKTKSTSFIKDDTLIALNGVFEGVKVYDDIYPEREGTLTSIDASNRLKVTDGSMFDLNERWQDTTSDYAWWLSLKGLTDTTEHHTTYQDTVVNSTKYLMAGTSAKLHFNSGNLAGYDFEVSSYDHDTHTFTLKRQTDERGLEIPNDDDSAFQAGVGDQYTLTDIMLPQSYITAAQQRLSAAAQADFDKLCVPRVKYELRIDELYIKEHCPNDVVAIDCGDYVTLTDADFVGSSTNVRVRRVERNLMSRYEYVLELEDVGVFRERRRIARHEEIQQRVEHNAFQFQPTVDISSVNSDVNFNGHEIVNAVVEKRETAPSSAKEGQIYYNTTEKETKQYNGTEWKRLGGALENYGVCSTISNNNIKLVSITSVKSLYAGLTVSVKFTNRNGSPSPKLKINEFSSKALMLDGNTPFGTIDDTTGWMAGSIYTFIYDGNQFIMSGKQNTYLQYGNRDFMLAYGTCTTEESVLTKIVLPNTGNLPTVSGGYLTVKFTNKVQSGAKMMTTSGVPKPIYHNGSAILDGVINAGDTVLFTYTNDVEGGIWIVLAVDNSIKKDILVVKISTSDGTEAYSETIETIRNNIVSGNIVVLYNITNHTCYNMVGYYITNSYTEITFNTTYLVNGAVSDIRDNGTIYNRQRIARIREGVERWEVKDSSRQFPYSSEWNKADSNMVPLFANSHGNSIITKTYSSSTTLNLRFIDACVKRLIATSNTVDELVLNMTIENSQQQRVTPELHIPSEGIVIHSGGSSVFDFIYLEESNMLFVTVSHL